MEIAIVIALIACSIAIFIGLHLRPLDNEEIVNLANKRRNKGIKNYYSFSRMGVVANPQFKKEMAADGAFYNIQSTLHEFPSLAAALLKYKKHEWMIVAFEKNRKIDLVWLHKGPDNSKVFFPHFQMIQHHAESGNYISVLIFHNHPNPDPNNFYLLGASQQDMEAAKSIENFFSQTQLSLLEFVCERGRFLQYHSVISLSLLPLQNFTAAVTTQNGKSRYENFELHLERIF
jgi:DNA repair protein RadC